MLTLGGAVQQMPSSLGGFGATSPSGFGAASTPSFADPSPGGFGVAAPSLGGFGAAAPGAGVSGFGMGASTSTQQQRCELFRAPIENDDVAAFDACLVVDDGRALLDSEKEESHGVRAALAQAEWGRGLP